MPAALDVDREQVRMLVLAVGVREAARRMDLSENTVLAWANRGGWLDQARPILPKIPLPPTILPRAIGAITPVSALEKILLERKERTKLAQSDYLAKASEKLADVPDELVLEHAATGKTLAEMASKVYPEAQTTDNSVHLSFFSVNCGQPEHQEPGSGALGHTLHSADVIELGADPDPLDDY